MMKVEDVKVKMDAAYDKWQKRLATTQKFRDRVEKNWQIIVKNGWDKYLQENGEFNPWDVKRETGSDKAFDVTYKYNDAKVDISSFQEASTTGVPYILFYSMIKR